MSRYFQSTALANASKTTLPILNKGKWELIPLPLPPLAEQKRIVAAVEGLLARTAALSASLAGAAAEREKLTAAALHRLERGADTAQADPDDVSAAWGLIREHFAALIDTPESVAGLKQTILQLAVQGRLVPQQPGDEAASELLKRIRAEKQRLEEAGEIRKSKPLPKVKPEEMPFALPEGWVWVRFGDITFNRDGERIPLSKDVREGRTGPYDYYGASGVIDHIDDYLFDKPLLLIGEDGANLINRSTPIAFIAYGKYWVNNHAHVLDAISLDVLKFLTVFVNAIDLKPYVTGTAQPKMNQAKMNSIVVALPPLAEQQRIVERVEALFALCDGLAGELEEAERVRGRWVAAVLAGVG